MRACVMYRLECVTLKRLTMNETIAGHFRQLTSLQTLRIDHSISRSAAAATALVSGHIIF